MYARNLYQTAAKASRPGRDVSGPHGKPLILIFSPCDKRRQGPTTTAHPLQKLASIGSLFFLYGTEEDQKRLSLIRLGGSGNSVSN